MTELTIVGAGADLCVALVGPAVNVDAVFDADGCQMVVYIDDAGSTSVASRAEGDPAEFDQCAAPFRQMLADHVRSQPADLERALPFLRDFHTPVELLRLLASMRAVATA